MTFNNNTMYVGKYGKILEYFQLWNKNKENKARHSISEKVMASDQSRASFIFLVVSGNDSYWQ